MASPDLVELPRWLDPVDGLILSYGGHDMEVAVDVAPVEGRI